MPQLSQLTFNQSLKVTKNEWPRLSLCFSSKFILIFVFLKVARASGFLTTLRQICPPPNSCYSIWSRQKIHQSFDENLSSDILHTEPKLNFKSENYFDIFFFFNFGKKNSIPFWGFSISFCLFIDFQVFGKKMILGQ